MLQNLINQEKDSKFIQDCKNYRLHLIEMAEAITKYRKDGNLHMAKQKIHEEIVSISFDFLESFVYNNEYKIEKEIHKFVVKKEGVILFRILFKEPLYYEIEIYNPENEQYVLIVKSTMLVQEGFIQGCIGDPVENSIDIMCEVDEFCYKMTTLLDNIK